jgi:hypothetical protein
VSDSPVSDAGKRQKRAFPVPERPITTILFSMNYFDKTRFDKAVGSLLVSQPFSENRREKACRRSKNVVILQPKKRKG